MPRECQTKSALTSMFEEEIDDNFVAPVLGDRPNRIGAEVLKTPWPRVPSTFDFQKSEFGCTLLPRTSQSRRSIRFRVR